MNIAIEKAAKDAAQKSALKLTPVLRNMASQAGWPGEVILELSVKAKDANIYIDYPEALDSTIQNLEYGEEKGTHKAALRPFMARYAAHLEQEVSESIVDILTEMGAFN